MAGLSDALGPLKLLSRVAKGIQEWLVQQGVIETTQQTPAITQLPSVRAALLEAEKEAAAAKQNALEAAAKAAEFGGYAPTDIQGQIYDAAVGGLQGGGTTILPVGAIKAASGIVGDLSNLANQGTAARTIEQVLSGITQVCQSINSNNGIPICSGLDPQAMFNAAVAKGLSPEGLDIADIPNYKGITVPTFDMDGIQNGTKVVSTLMGQSSITPVKPEQIEQPPTPVRLVEPRSTFEDVMPMNLLKKLTANMEPSLEDQAEEEFI
jgi:hypothetical protein